MASGVSADVCAPRAKGRERGPAIPQLIIPFSLDILCAKLTKMLRKSKYIFYAQVLLEGVNISAGHNLALSLKNLTGVPPF